MTDGIKDQAIKDQAARRLAGAAARAVAISQPQHVDINAILFRPTRQEL
jgi:NADP-dependent 3-hydroxy acid dehydrogenase YdfG